MVMDEHKVSLEELCKRTGTSLENGLTPIRAKENSTIYGRNALTPLEPTPEEWVKVCQKLFGGFAIFLWLGAFLCFIVYSIQASAYEEPPANNLYLGVVLTVVVVSTGLYSYYYNDESPPPKKYEPLHYTICVRGGNKLTIKAEELTVGDIVEVMSGDRIPADIRIIEAHGFKVDLSSLTGESEPQFRSSEFTDDNPIETKNLAFSSTRVVEGCARGIVIKIGDNTVLGRVAGLTTVLETGDESLNPNKITHLIHLGTAATVLVLAVFLNVKDLL